VVDPPLRARGLAGWLMVGLAGAWMGAGWRRVGGLSTSQPLYSFIRCAHRQRHQGYNMTSERGVGTAASAPALLLDCETVRLLCVLCCAVCCAVLCAVCCAVLCCAVLCGAVCSARAFLLSRHQPNPTQTQHQNHYQNHNRRPGAASAAASCPAGSPGTRSTPPS